MLDISSLVDVSLAQAKTLEARCRDSDGAYCLLSANVWMALMSQ